MHGVGGSLGSCLLGLLADPEECAVAKGAPATCNNPGTVTRSPYQFGLQTGATMLCAIYSMVVSYFLLKVHLTCFRTVKPRMEDSVDVELLDETAYAWMHELEPGAPPRRPKRAP